MAAPGDLASREPAPGLDPELVARLAAQPVGLVELDDPVADADHAVVARRARRGVRVRRAPAAR